MSSPLESVAAVFARRFSRLGKEPEILPQDFRNAEAAIEALREGAVDRVDAMEGHMMSLGRVALISDYVDAILGPPPTT